MHTITRRSFFGSTALAAGAGLALADDDAKIDETRPGKTPRTKFAVNVEMWWRKVPNFLDRLRAAAALGFPAVEIWPWQNKDVSAVADLPGLTQAQMHENVIAGLKPAMPIVEAEGITLLPEALLRIRMTDVTPREAELRRIAVPSRAWDRDERRWENRSRHFESRLGERHVA